MQRGAPARHGIAPLMHRFKALCISCYKGGECCEGRCDAKPPSARGAAAADVPHQAGFGGAGVNPYMTKAA